MFALLLALLAASPAASAVEVPRGSALDARVKHVAYKENEVVAVYVSQGMATHIKFAPGEEVRFVASGFGEGWTIAQRENNLFLKAKSIAQGEGLPGLSPVPGQWDTNLVVTTSVRDYSFQLHLIGPSSGRAKLPHDSRQAYRIVFSYPDQDAERVRAAADAAKAKERLAQRPAIRNTNYTMQVGKRSSSIAPTMAYDDGLFTYLQFPNNREIPAVFLVNEDGTESLVNTNVRDDVVVVQRVAKRLTLRLGKAVVAVFNEAYNLDGVKPTNGTTVPGVDREVLSLETVQ